MTDVEARVPPPQASHLFTVRVWQEDLGNGEMEWRGKVQHVLSRETHYFREWSMLTTCLLAMLENAANQIGQV